MTKLYVLYDARCELCCRLKNWILMQRSWIGLAVLKQGSEEAKRLFPELEKVATKDDLAVVSDEGAVYLNERAWIMVFYALVGYRDWAAADASTADAAGAAGLRRHLEEPALYFHYPESGKRRSAGRGAAQGGN